LLFSGLVCCVGGCRVSGVGETRAAVVDGESSGDGDARPVSSIATGVFWCGDAVDVAVAVERIDEDADDANKVDGDDASNVDDA